ncbi:heme o synthase [Halococcus salifodinae]|uniref:Protoheme IX farnesyltransferase n=1 Tax=Halococcus salifodinae DSM 8989 TaxID=1227456 RepID=M0MU79_9EURY|nr:heme o synthase [Halococcus salifodinae]EMA49297.1 protoheme IX farnesyltransferase [Halococcus salifodinae DSM 8989]
MATDTDSVPTRVTTLLAAAAVGVYLLIVIGATTTLSHAAAACTTWPACGVDLSNPRLAIAWGHRIAAALVGLLVLGAIVAAWRAPTPRRAKTALAVPFVLYPVQIGIGALAATTSAEWISTAHLLCGVGIFTGLVVALAWTLEIDAPGTDTPAAAADTDARAADAAPSAATATEQVTAGTVSADDSDEPAVVENDVEPLSNRSPSPADEGLIERARTVGTAYFRLMKPRLMWLLCLVAAAGMALAAGPNLDAGTVVRVLGGGVLAIGASGTFNHVLERDIDRRMQRTADRPLATDEVGVRNAMIFGCVLAVASLGLFATVNLLSAALGLCAILFYSVIYTLVLKPNTVQNTVLGGAAGALPAIIGWVGVTGKIGIPGLALAGVIFLWTPAHFYNLALAYKDDYERGGFPMMPLVRGDRVTRRHILWYLGATLLGASVLAAVAELGWLYGAATVAFGGLFLWAVVRLHRERTEDAAFRAFHASNAYLGAVLVAVVIDAVVL